MTIFSVIMISVMTIFIFSSNLSAQVDINRSMQENIKNAVETIAEDVRKSEKISIKDAVSSCGYANSEPHWEKLCVCLEWDSENLLCTDESRYLLKKNLAATTDIFNTDSMTLVWTVSDCLPLESHCRLFKSGSPLTNSLVSIKEIEFNLSWDQNNQSKIGINFTIKPSVRRWVRSDLIKASEIIFQTTISKRLIQTK